LVLVVLVVLRQVEAVSIQYFPRSLLLVAVAVLVVFLMVLLVVLVARLVIIMLRELAVLVLQTKAMQVVTTGLLVRRFHLAVAVALVQ
jgi:hypothetical protein